MSDGPHAARRGPAARRSPLRTALIACVLGASMFGLSACRTLEDDGNADRDRPAKQSQVAAAPAPEVVAETTPVDSPTTPELATTPDDPATASDLDADAAADEPGADSAAEDPEAEAASADPSPGAAAEGESEGAVKSERVESGPPKPIDPWRLVGQPYLVDDEAPEASPDGLTTYTLWFRTKGEFRGVRQGTSVTDDRHYKVGLIALPSLPGFVPGGVGMLQRSDRMVEEGRYCYTAEVHVDGQRGNRRFPIHRDGAEVQVELDLRDAPVQRRTATILVRDTATENPPITPAEKALACR